MKLINVLILLTFAIHSFAISKDEVESSMLSGLKFRAIGPALASGRIIDLAVNPNNYNEFYVAVASGGVYKTTNKGSSFEAIFDNYGSYSIGCVTIDPNNHNTIWVGTGENNSQRAVSYGDGLYKSEDGGKSFKNVGLKNSEHIAKVIVHPSNSNIVYVAAQGPLWKDGGDRGLYKTTNGGKDWVNVLEISPKTGVTDLLMDPRNPDVLYAASYQRRRHVWTLINGGPESALYKSEDAGKTWNKLENGLPSGLLGRIGLAISPADPDYVYAIVEASGTNGGFFRSTDRGASWEKRNPFISGSAQYYQELFPHPTDKNSVYAVSTYTSLTTDGGKTFEKIGLKERHVDDHAMWINPTNPKHILIGGDGGLYETYDDSKTWRFFENLSVTQFYRVSVDNDYPFYNIYGGTQDNNTIGGPTRTQNADGLMNQDFYFTVGGDGFKTVIDPKDPNILYSQPQYGFLVRYDKRSGEITGIQPQEEENEELRWNWNSPVIISPFDNKTLYFAANKLFKSTNQGNSWAKISGDLSQQIDRNTLKVMDKVWEPEAVAKNASTSLYGNIVSLDESSKKKGLIYVGTDDGLIQVTENDGTTWAKYSSFTGVPETTYVSDLEADLFDENTVYATFDNRKRGDFKPYIMKSNNKGKTWVSIANGLPENLPVHSIKQDHVKSDLLFIGTEFGVYYTYNGGKNWIKLSAGLPTICVKEIEIQRRENDLALGTFGRGFYILDDYSALREINDEMIKQEAKLFPIKDSWMYIEDRSFGRRSLGETFWRGENHPYGAVFTFFIKDNYETLKSKRQKEAKELEKKGQSVKYPSFAELKLEDDELKPSLIFIIKDDKGNTVRKLTSSYKKGLQRIVWDLRYPDTAPLSSKSDINKSGGFPIMPGKYTVSIYKEHYGELTKISDEVSFNAKVLDNKTMPATNSAELMAFHIRAFEVRKNLDGANNYIKSVNNKLKVLENGVLFSNEANNELLAQINKINIKLDKANILVNGDASKSSRNANQTPSMSDRLGNMLYSFWYSSSDPTETNKKGLDLLEKQYTSLKAQLISIESDIESIEQALTNANSPWLPDELRK
jgi:photosystem II stability/assembly factor-like uncharacterized protein